MVVKLKKSPKGYFEGSKLWAHTTTASGVYFTRGGIFSSCLWLPGGVLNFELSPCQTPGCVRKTDALQSGHF